MWRAGARTIVSDAVELLDGMTTADHAEVVDALRHGWGPVFQKLPDTAMQNSASKFLNRLSSNLLTNGLPSPPEAKEFCDYAWHCKPSTSGKDYLHYSAWATAAGGRTLQENFSYRRQAWSSTQAGINR